MVYLAASRSKDPRTKIGAVLVKHGQVISTGFNGFVRKVLDTPERWNVREEKYKFVCHAEFNAVVNAARMGQCVFDSIIYTQGIPCHECTKAVLQAGVREIVVHKQWPTLQRIEKWANSNAIAAQMYEETGVTIRYIDKILGVEGLCNGELVSV